MTCQEANIEKNLTEFYKWLPSNDYAQKKSYAYFAVPICVKRQFQG